MQCCLRERVRTAIQQVTEASRDGTLQTVESLAPLLRPETVQLLHVDDAKQLEHGAKNTMQLLALHAHHGAAPPGGSLDGQPCSPQLSVDGKSAKRPQQPTDNADNKRARSSSAALPPSNNDCSPTGAAQVFL